MANYKEIRVLFVGSTKKNIETVQTMFDRTIAAFTMQQSKYDDIILDCSEYCFESDMEALLDHYNLRLTNYDSWHKAANEEESRENETAGETDSAQESDGETERDSWIRKASEEIWQQIWDKIYVLATVGSDVREPEPADLVIAVDEITSCIRSMVGEEAWKQLKVPYFGMAGVVEYVQRQKKDKIWLFRAEGAPVFKHYDNILVTPPFALNGKAVLCEDLCSDLTDIYCKIFPRIFDGLDAAMQNQVQVAYDLWAKHFRNDCRKPYWHAKELLAQALGKQEFIRQHNIEFTRCFIELAQDRGAEYIMIEPQLYKLLKQQVFDELKPHLQLLDPGVYLARYFIENYLS